MDTPRTPRQPIRAAEFFAGIGLVRLGVERAGVEVVFANDIDPVKQAIYAENFGSGDFLLADVRGIRGDDVPDVEIATASFPCTDLSLAGNMLGLAGEQSGMFWQFARIIEEMGDRQPQVVMLENVPSFATSHGGSDMRAAIVRLNELGYTCDVFNVDARLFVPQSRPRLFIVGTLTPVEDADNLGAGTFRSDTVTKFITAHDDLDLHGVHLPHPAPMTATLADCVDRLRHTDERWWDAERVGRFVRSLSPRQAERLDFQVSGGRLSWSTAYRRTRAGVAVWEIRPDKISGCLRTARGGSSKQAVVEAGKGNLRVRWMTTNEYAALQGAPGFRHSTVSANQAMFGFGDAVCVPAIEWIAKHYLTPLVSGALTPEYELACGNTN